MKKILKMVKLKYLICRKWINIPKKDKKNYKISYKKIRRIYKSYFSSFRCFLSFSKDIIIKIAKIILLFLLPIALYLVLTLLHLDSNYLDFNSVLSYFGISIAIFSSAVISIVIATSNYNRSYFKRKNIDIFLVFPMLKFFTPLEFLGQCFFHIIYAVCFLRFSLLSSVISCSIILLCSLLLIYSYLRFSLLDENRIFEIYAIKSGYFVKSNRRNFISTNKTLLKKDFNYEELYSNKNNGYSFYFLCKNLNTNINYNYDLSESINELVFYMKLLPNYIDSYNDLWNITFFMSYINDLVYKPLIGTNNICKVLQIFDLEVDLIKNVIDSKFVNQFAKVDEIKIENNELIIHKNIGKYIHYYSNVSAINCFVNQMINHILESFKPLVIDDLVLNDEYYLKVYNEIKQKYNAVISELNERINKSNCVLNSITKFLENEKKYVLKVEKEALMKSDTNNVNNNSKKCGD